MTLEGALKTRYRIAAVLAAAIAAGAIAHAQSQTFICTPAPTTSPSPSPEPSPSPTPPPSGEPYTFETRIDLVPSEPRLWYALQAPGPFGNWGTNGLATSVVVAYEANPSLEWLAYCNFSGTGCSASTAATDLLNFQEGVSPAHKVLWRLTWYPRTPSADVRLVLMDSGFSNPITLATTELEAKLDRAYTVGADVTAAWNAAGAGGAAKYLGMSSRGDGRIGAVIYQSRVTIIHRIVR